MLTYARNFLVLILLFTLPSCLPAFWSDIQFASDSQSNSNSVFNDTLRTSLSAHNRPIDLFLTGETPTKKYTKVGFIEVEDGSYNYLLERMKQIAQRTGYDAIIDIQRDLKTVQVFDKVSSVNFMSGVGIKYIEDNEPIQSPTIKKIEFYSIGEDITKNKYNLIGFVNFANNGEIISSPENTESENIYKENLLYFSYSELIESMDKWKISEKGERKKYFYLINKTLLGTVYRNYQNQQVDSVGIKWSEGNGGFAGYQGVHFGYSGKSGNSLPDSLLIYKTQSQLSSVTLPEKLNIFTYENIKSRKIESVIISSRKNNKFTPEYLALYQYY